MRRLLIPIAVVVVSFVAGATVAGRPMTVANDVSIDDIHAPDSSVAASSHPSTPIEDPGLSTTTSLAD